MDSSQKISELENRIEYMEKMLGINAASKSPASAAPEPSLPPADLPLGAARKTEEFSLLGVGGIFCLILAAVYLIKLAVDAGWLTPVRQVTLASALGLGLIVAGIKIKSKDREYLSYLPAGGIVVLLLSFLGGCLYHHLYSPMVALLLAAGAATATIYLYERLRLFPYLILSKIGAYLVPFAFLGNIQTELIQIYFLVISTTYTVMAVSLNSRAIAVLAAYFGLFVTSVFGFSDKAHLPEAALYLASQVLIFLSGTLYHTLKSRRPLEVKESLLYFPLILFFYGLEYAFVSQIFPDLAPFISIGFAMFMLAVLGLLKAKLPAGTKLPSEDLLVSASFVVLTHSVYFVMLPETSQPIFFMVLLFMAAYFYHQVFIPESWNLFRKVLSVAGGAFLIWNYALVLYSLMYREDSLWTVSGFFMSGGLLGLLKMSKLFRPHEEEMPWLLYAPHVMVAASFYGLFKNTGSFAVSASWALYALVILGYGLFQKDRAVARSSMVLLILSSIKVFFYDLSGVNTGGRILSLLVTGILLYTAGWVFRKV